MDPENIMNGLSKEILDAIKEIGKAKTPEEKLMYSKTVKNLCTSLEVFLNLLTDIDPFDDVDEPLAF